MEARHRGESHRAGRRVDPVGAFAGDAELAPVVRGSRVGEGDTAGLQRRRGGTGSIVGGHVEFDRMAVRAVSRIVMGGRSDRGHGDRSQRVRGVAEGVGDPIADRRGGPNEGRQRIEAGGAIGGNGPGALTGNHQTLAVILSGAGSEHHRCRLQLADRTEAVVAGGVVGQQRESDGDVLGCRGPIILRLRRPADLHGQGRLGGLPELVGDLVADRRDRAGEAVCCGEGDHTGSADAEGADSVQDKGLARVGCVRADQQDRTRLQRGQRTGVVVGQDVRRHRSGVRGVYDVVGRTRGSRSGDVELQHCGGRGAVGIGDLVGDRTGQTREAGGGGEGDHPVDDPVVTLTGNGERRATVGGAAGEQPDAARHQGRRVGAGMIIGEQLDAHRRAVTGCRVIVDRLRPHRGHRDRDDRGSRIAEAVGDPVAGCRRAQEGGFRVEGDPTVRRDGPGALAVDDQLLARLGGFGCGELHAVRGQSAVPTGTVITGHVVGQNRQRGVHILLGGGCVSVRHRGCAHGDGQVRGRRSAIAVADPVGRRGQPGEAAGRDEPDAAVGLHTPGALAGAEPGAGVSGCRVGEPHAGRDQRQLLVAGRVVAGHVSGDRGQVRRVPGIIGCRRGDGGDRHRDGGRVGVQLRIGDLVVHPSGAGERRLRDELDQVIGADRPGALAGDDQRLAAVGGRSVGEHHSGRDQTARNAGAIIAGSVIVERIDRRRLALLGAAEVVGRVGGGADGDGQCGRRRGAVQVGDPVADRARLPGEAGRRGEGDRTGRAVHGVATVGGDQALAGCPARTEQDHAERVQRGAGVADQVVVQDRHRDRMGETGVGSVVRGLRGDPDHGEGDGRRGSIPEGVGDGVGQLGFTDKGRIGIKSDPLVVLDPEGARSGGRTQLHRTGIEAARMPVAVAAGDVIGQDGHGDVLVLQAGAGIRGRGRSRPHTHGEGG